MQYNSNTLSQMNLKNIILSSALALLFIFNSSNALALDFTLLTDIHVTPGNENEKQLIAAIDEINNNSSSFVIISGDLSNEGSDEQLYNIKRIVDKLNKPLYIIPKTTGRKAPQKHSMTFGAPTSLYSRLTVWFL